MRMDDHSRLAAKRKRGIRRRTPRLRFGLVGNRRRSLFTAPTATPSSTSSATQRLPHRGADAADIQPQIRQQFAALAVLDEAIRQCPDA